MSHKVILSKSFNFRRFSKSELRMVENIFQDFYQTIGGQSENLIHKYEQVLPRVKS